MVTTNKPVIFLVPGAFAQPSCYDRLIPILQAKGYDTETCALPSSNPAKQPEDCTSAADAGHIRETYLVPMIEEKRRNVIIFAHSYGALCGGAAASGFAHNDRKSKGEDGCVMGFIFQSGTMMPGNMALMETFGNQNPPFFKIDHPIPGCAIIDPIIETLYGDADKGDIEKLLESMTPHALKAFHSKSPQPAWASSSFDSHRVYIRTGQDHCQPPQVQDIFMKTSGMDWVIEHLDASHGAFFTRPHDVAEIIDRYASQWFSAY